MRADKRGFKSVEISAYAYGQFDSRVTVAPLHASGVDVEAKLSHKSFDEPLAKSLDETGSDIAMAATTENGSMQVQPVFCLMRASLLESLVRYTHGGGRKIDRWTAMHRAIEVPFDDPRAFFNANTLAELQRLQHG